MRKYFSSIIYQLIDFYIFSLDPELKDELVLIITKLLADKTIVSKENRRKN
jgi:hypothetical protein